MLCSFFKSERLLCKSFEASNFVGFFHEDGSGISYQRQREVSNGHLIFDGSDFVMGGLFDFTIAQSREVSFHFGAYFIGFFKQETISGDFCPGIVGDV